MLVLTDIAFSLQKSNFRSRDIRYLDNPPPSHPPHHTPSPPSTNNKPEATAAVAKPDTAASEKATGVPPTAKDNGGAVDLRSSAEVVTVTGGDEKDDKTTSLVPVEELSKTGELQNVEETMEKVDSTKSTRSESEKACNSEEGNPPANDRKPQALVKPLTLALERQPLPETADHGTSGQTGNAEIDALRSIGIDGLNPKVKKDGM